MQKYSTQNLAIQSHFNTLLERN